MTTPQSLHHSLLRPCVLHILRAQGYHSTRPSVLDAFTDLAARYMYMLAESTADHASVNHTELEITVQDVRMAMQDCAILGPEKVIEDQEFEGEEDMRGVEGFIAWATGKPNREIRRVALEGTEGLQEDYLAGLSLDAILIFRLTQCSPEEKARCYGRRLQI
jgi:transcription initiation factor TFIID subunit 3